MHLSHVKASLIDCARLFSALDDQAREQILLMRLLLLLDIRHLKIGLAARIRSRGHITVHALVRCVRENVLAKLAASLG